MTDQTIRLIKLARSSHLTLQRQIMDRIEERIAAGELKPGDRIPPERELAVQWGVSALCVHQALRELGRKGCLARAPRRGTFVAAAGRAKPQRVVGLMINKGLSPTHPVLIQRLAAVDTVLTRRQFSQQLMFFDDEEDQAALVDGLRQRVDLAGVILFNEVQPSVLDYFEAHKFPAVRQSGLYPNRKIHCVCSDAFHEAYVGTAHLLNHGRSRIAFIRGPALPLNDEAAAGYRLALEEALGPKGAEPVIRESEFGRESGRRLMEELLREHPGLTAVQCCEDMVALGAWDVLRAAGRRVPGDFALIGSGNFEAWLGLEPSLTTFDVGFEATSRCAAEILLRLIDGEADVPLHTIRRPRLIVRRSCGCPPATGDGARREGLRSAAPAGLLAGAPGDSAGAVPAAPLDKA